jgi:hypothetical protein
LPTGVTSMEHNHWQELAYMTVCCFRYLYDF